MSTKLKEKIGEGQQKNCKSGTKKTAVGVLCNYDNLVNLVTSQKDNVYETDTFQRNVPHWKIMNLKLCTKTYSSKACISDGIEVHWCLWHGQLMHLERHHQCRKMYGGFRTCVLIQMMSFSGKVLLNSARQS